VKVALTTTNANQQRPISNIRNNVPDTDTATAIPTKKNQASFKITNDNYDMDSIQPVSAIERQLLKLARGQREVYRKIRPAPGFVRAISPRTSSFESSSASPSSDHLPATGKVVLPSLGVLHNKRLRQLDRLKTIIARINVSNNSTVLLNLMQQFFDDCAQADASTQSTTINPTPTDTASNDSNHDDKSDIVNDMVERTDWDQILETGIRTASRLGNLSLAEALMEQTKRMGLSIYVQLATHRVYRAIIEATWSHTKDACRVAHWVNEMNQTGIMLDIDTTLIIQKWAVTNIAEPSFIRLNEEDSCWSVLPGFEKHATTSSDTLSKLVQQQRQSPELNRHKYHGSVERYERY
jgi:hypothetical protein